MRGARRRRPLSVINVPNDTPVSIAPNLSFNYALPAGTHPSEVNGR